MSLLSAKSFLWFFPLSTLFTIDPQCPSKYCFCTYCTRSVWPACFESCWWGSPLYSCKCHHQLRGPVRWSVFSDHWTKRASRRFLGGSLLSAMYILVLFHFHANSLMLRIHSVPILWRMIRPPRASTRGLDNPRQKTDNGHKAVKHRVSHTTITTCNYITCMKSNIDSEPEIETNWYLGVWGNDGWCQWKVTCTRVMGEWDLVDTGSRLLDSSEDGSRDASQVNSLHNSSRLCSVNRVNAIQTKGLAFIQTNLESDMNLIIFN